MRSRTARWGQPWIVLMVIAYWSLLFMATHLPKIPRPRIVNFDKFAHLVAFAILAFLFSQLAFSFRGRSYLKVLLVSIGLFLYALFDEVSQASFGRTTDLADLAADSFGIVIGIAFAWMLAFRTKLRNAASGYR
jgi:VanZ family protein